MTEDSTYLEGSKPEADIRGNLSLSSIASGTLQAELETEVGNYIPCKGIAQLTNARLQRTAIALSSDLFRWDAYPTFYGSKYVYVPKDDVLLGLPGKATPGEIKKLQAGLEAYNSFASRHGNLDIAMYCVMNSDYLVDSPSSQYKSNPMNYSTLNAELLEKLVGFRVIPANVPYEDYIEQWYATDHHWNIDGAYRAYCDIVEQSPEWGLPYSNSARGGGGLTIPDAQFRGSVSRSALYDKEKYDTFFDYEFVLPDYEVTIDGKPYDQSWLCQIDQAPQIIKNGNAYTNYYVKLYHANWGELVIRNPSSENDNSLLLIADSYSNCIDRLFASHFQTTYVFDARYNTETLDSYIESHPDITNVLFLMNPGSLLRDASLTALDKTE